MPKEVCFNVEKEDYIILIWSEKLVLPTVSKYSLSEWPTSILNKFSNLTISTQTYTWDLHS